MKKFSKTIFLFVFIGFFLLITNFTYDKGQSLLAADAEVWVKIDDIEVNEALKKMQFEVDYTMSGGVRFGGFYDHPLLHVEWQAIGLVIGTEEKEITTDGFSKVIFNFADNPLIEKSPDLPLWEYVPSLEGLIFPLKMKKDLGAYKKGSIIYAFTGIGGYNADQGWFFLEKK